MVHEFKNGERFAQVMTPYTYVDGFGVERTTSHYTVACFLSFGQHLVSESLYTSWEGAESAAIRFVDSPSFN